MNSTLSINNSKLDKDKKKNSLSKKEIEFGFETLEEFCRSHDWKVQYLDHPEKNQESVKDRIISLNKNRKPEIILYIFLHELGHLWLLECDFSYVDKYPELVKTKPRYATATYKLAKVQEEIEAWEVGKKLARSLGLKINERKFEKVRAECLMSYVAWAAKRKLSSKTKSNPNIISSPPVSSSSLLNFNTESLNNNNTSKTLNFHLLSSTKEKLS